MVAPDASGAKCLCGLRSFGGEATTIECVGLPSTSGSRMSIRAVGGPRASSPSVKRAGVLRFLRRATASDPDSGEVSDVEFSGLAAALLGVRSGLACDEPIGGRGSLLRSITFRRTGGPNGVGFPAIGSTTQRAKIDRLKSELCNPQPPRSHYNLTSWLTQEVDVDRSRRSAMVKPLGWQFA